ncbi:glycerophosphodiester phosphodiesterase family protein [Arthrobacter sp. lap29]|uniref:glycerophosphodiester phosphodiesterase n=1 Tax=Arthrobacter sp. lap29 TaxID=3056122 RepID=UPI0028F749F4|nr:glycerophosphodiester phosphodiesterase family protein [Arthrobacter sp. lap29]
MPGPYIFKQIFAADPANTSNVATNASILIFAPGDASMTPLIITDASTGLILANPTPTNANGFGSTFAHATLDQVAWEGGGFSGTFESYQGMKEEAVAARAAAQASAQSAETAAAEATATVTEALAGAVGDAQAAAAAAAASAALVGAPADVITAALVGNPETATGRALIATIGQATADKITQSQGDARYQQSSPDLLAKLPIPYYIAHRGGANMAPEQSMEGFRIAAATGIDILEADIQRTADGALVAMHDDTVNRTTDGTGLVSDYTLPAFLSLNAAAKIPWKNVSPPATLQQMLAEFGPQRVLQIEPKDAGTLDAMLDAAETAHVENSVQIETNNLAVAQAAVARGYEVWFFWNISIASPSVASVVAAGVNYLAVSAGATDADISTLVATGKSVTVYAVERRSERDRVLAMGVQGISSDNPVYVKATKAMRKRDSWIQGVWGHGLNTNRTVRPKIENGALVLDQSAGAIEIITPGEVLPIAAAAGTYTIDLDLGWKTLPTDMAKALQVNFAIDSDRNYDFQRTNNPDGYPECYQAHVRANGSIEIYRVTKATGSTGPMTGNLSTPAFVAGNFAHLRITVTPTGFTVQRTDTSSAVATVTDATCRGSYIRLTRFSTADGVGMFKNLVIS